MSSSINSNKSNTHYRIVSFTMTIDDLNNKNLPEEEKQFVYKPNDTSNSENSVVDNNIGQFSLKEDS